MSSEAAQSLSSPQAVWQAILEVIKENVNIRSFNTWFAPIEAVDIEDDYLKLSVPNRIFLRMDRQSLLKTGAKCHHANFGRF